MRRTIDPAAALGVLAIILYTLGFETGAGIIVFFLAIRLLEDL